MLGFSESDVVGYTFVLTANLGLPQGFSVPYFSGSFNGGGHTLSNLSISLPDSMRGMFGYVPNAASTIANLGVVNANVGGQSYVGGLVGYNDTGSISNSYAKGSVTIGSASDSYVGGLVGLNNGTITQSFASVNVTVGQVGGSSYVGGLTGANFGGNISQSFSTGNVNVGGSAGSYRVAGGLVGINSGSIDNSYAMGNVNASGAVGGSSYVGGLVGEAGGSISNSYAAGSVSLSGAVTGPSSVGGLIGIWFGTSNTHNFYDKTVNPSLNGISGTADVAGQVWGMSTPDMKNQGNFTGATTANGNVNPAWDFATTPVWMIVPGSNAGYPCLAWTTCTPPTPIYLDILDGSSIYGSAPSFTYGYYTTPVYGSGTAVTDAGELGTATWSGVPTATSGVAIYSLLYGGGITLGNGTYTLLAGNAAHWTVNPAPLTVTASNASKVYGQIPNLSGFTSSGLVNNETIGSTSLSSSGTAVTAGVAAGPYPITPSGATGGTFNAANYSISYVNGSLTVTPLVIAVAANNGATRVYDGSANAAASLLNVSNAINGDIVNLSGSATLASANAGAETISSITGLTLSDTNYTVVGASVSGSVAVSAASLTVTASNASKVYGQTPTLSGFTSSGLVNNETIGSVTVTSSGTAVTAGVAAGPYTIVASAATGGSFAPGNYSISYVNGSLTVTPLAIAVAANSGATRVYDGSTNAAASLLNVVNAINGDIVNLSGSATLAAGSAGAEAISSIAGLSVSNPNYTVVGGGASGSVVIEAPATASNAPTLDNTIANAINTPANTQLPSQDLPSVSSPAVGNSNASGQPSTFVNVTNPLPSVSAAFGPGERFAVVSSPSANEPTQAVTLSQARTMMQGAGGGAADGEREIRVPVSRNSLADIVNGGVKLPDGVEQQLFVVQAN